jgi:hypothetical protein
VILANKKSMWGTEKKETTNGFRNVLLALAAIGILSAIQVARGTPRPQADNLKITNDSLPNATVGLDYYCVIAVSGGKKPYDYAATGLPPGLAVGALKYAHDTILGKPTQAGTFSPVITVSDSTQPMPVTTTVTLRLTVVPAH